MKPSVKKRWVVVGTAVALGAGVAGAAAIGLDDQAGPTESVDAVTLNGQDDDPTAGPSDSPSPTGSDPAGTVVADPSPESPDSPQESEVDTAGSADDTSAQSARSAETATPSPQKVQSSASADSGR